MSAVSFKIIGRTKLQSHHIYNHCFNQITTLSGPTTTTTATSAVVEPSLDNRDQPVATEHAVPLTLTQFNSPLVAGM